jgi:ABC-type transport system involved in cytochrome c biogenesis permease subunit
MKKWTPLTVTIVFVLYVISGLFGLKNPKDGPPIVEFGRIPVLKDGRHQPMDSVARNALLLIRKKQTLNTEPWKGDFDHPVIISATQWMMELMMDPQAADNRPCFRIDHGDLKNLLHLPMEADEGAHADGKHYSWNQINAQMNALMTETRRASQVMQDLRNPFERAVMELWQAAGVYKSLRLSLGPAGSGEMATALPEYRKKLLAAQPQAEAQMSGRPYDADLAEWFNTQDGGTLLVIPPRHARGDWTRAISEVSNTPEGGTPHYALTAFGQMTAAWRAKDWSGMEKIINGYLGALKEDGLSQVKQANLNEDEKDCIPSDLGKAKSEQLFNHLELFYRGMIVAVTALLFALLVWFHPVKFEWARKTAMGLTTLTLVILAAGVLWRMIHEGRPPVTNLYSSALFIGMAAVALGLILEKFFPYSIGVAVAAMGAFGTLILAHFLALEGDTMIMLRAVLDTNFWLATHVVIVTLGYASTFVAGFIGMFYLFRAVFSRHVTKQMQKAFSSMVFAIICFASLFSFVGTVLGGIWADQSWGRFWGWDPKENGALIIVLWNVMILHARLGGMVRERGLLNLAIGGNIVTGWSWFGTNMLGVGLHSYGFMDAAKTALYVWVGFNFVLMLIGCIPQRFWESFKERPEDDPAPGAGPGIAPAHPHSY